MIWISRQTYEEKILPLHIVEKISVCIRFGFNMFF